MMVLADRYRIRIPLLIFMGGIAFGFLLVFFFRFFKNTYATFLTCGLLVPFIVIIVGNSKHFLLAILTMLLPITVDITLNNTGHIGGTAGYVISAFDIVLAVLYLLWFNEMVRKKNLSVDLFPRISIPAFFLIAIAALSMVFAKFPLLSKFELIEVVKMYFCFFYFANNIKSERDVQFLVLFLLSGLFLESIIGFAQHRYGDPFWPTALGGPPRIEGSRINGTWLSFNDFSWYLGLILPIALSMLFSGIKLIYKLICGLTFFLGCGSLMWTNSRGGWISFAIAAIFVALCVFRNIKGKVGLIKTFAWIIAVFIFISPIYPRLAAKFYDRFGGSDAGAAESRLPQYEVAYKIIKENPIIGIGINNYTKIMGKYDVTEDGLESITRHPVHNIFLHIAAEIGIFGITVFLWLISSILIEGIKYIVSNQDFIAYTVIGMIAGIIAFLVHGLVDTASLGNKLYMFIWFFAAIIFAVNKNVSGFHHPSPS